MRKVVTVALMILSFCMATEAVAKWKGNDHVLVKKAVLPSAHQTVSLCAKMAPSASLKSLVPDKCLRPVFTGCFCCLGV